MKQIVKNSLIGIGLYLLAGTIFYGYHPYMLPTFLLLMAITSFLLFRKEKQEEVRKGLVWINAPLLLLLTVTSLFTGNFKTVLTYLIFVPLVALLIYFVIFPNKRIAFLMGILAVVAISFFSFDSISGTTEVFDASYLETFSRLVKR